VALSVSDKNWRRLWQGPEIRPKMPLCGTVAACRPVALNITRTKKLADTRCCVERKPDYALRPCLSSPDRRG